VSKKIGEMLVERGLLTTAQVEKGLEAQKFHGGRVGSIWAQLGWLQEKDLLETLAVQKRAKPCKASLLKNVTRGTLDLLPVKVAVKYKVIPLIKEGRRLSVAMVDPNDLLALDELQFISGCVVEPFLATERTIVNALEKYYSVQPVRKEPMTLEGKSMPMDKPVAPPPPGVSAPPKEGETEAFIDAKAKAEAEAARRFWSEQLKPPGASGPLLPPPPVVLGAPPLLVPASAPASAATSPAPRAPADPEVMDGNALLVDEAETVAIVETAPDPLEEAGMRLSRVEIRDDIADVLLWCTEGLCKRVALFIFQKGRTLGWTGQGEGLTSDMVRRVVVPIEDVSAFTLVRDQPRHYLGPLPRNPVNERLVEAMGGKWPPAVLIIPFGIKGRGLGCLYAEDELTELQAIELPLLFQLLQKAGLALEILVLRAKLRHP
jgi:hypothetical protein